MNAHPFIVGLNSGLGMSLAFIPDLILKYKFKNKISKKDEMILFGKKRKIIYKFLSFYYAAFVILHKK